MFDNVTELRKHAQAWVRMYNNERPHSALGYLTPVELLLKYGKLLDGLFPSFQQDINIIINENKKNNENFSKFSRN
jgi:putative transposase